MEEIGRKQGDQTADPFPLRRRRDQTQERYKATWSGLETEKEKEAKKEEEEDRYRETPSGAPIEVIHMGV